MQKLLRFLILWLVTGVFYYAGEGIWRLGEGGWASIYMLPIGGFCIAVTGSLHHLPGWYSMRVPVQALLGAVFITTVEYGSGMLLNHYLGLAVWDYSDIILNFKGQICLPYSILWFFLMPAAIWLCDWLRSYLWYEGKSYTLWHIYKCFGTGKWVPGMIQS